ncbi:hypothetical protein J6590_042018 [Homalodisca vitripennis]|nr:hypothetical protein J6590_042018 [Homalodisca vitripennis]
MFNVCVRLPGPGSIRDLFTLNSFTLHHLSQILTYNCPILVATALARALALVPIFTDGHETSQLCLSENAALKVELNKAEAKKSIGEGACKWDVLN